VPHGFNDVNVETEARVSVRPQARYLVSEVRRHIARSLADARLASASIARPYLQLTSRDREGALPLRR